MLTRRSLIVFATSLAACQHQRTADRRNVLFICQFGTAKSAVAREMTRRRATELGIAVDVASRGITPEDHVSAGLARRLAADRIDPARVPVQALDPATLGRAQIVVLFDPLPREFRRADALDWSMMPSLNNDYAEAKAFLSQRIDALLQRVQHDSRWNLR